MPNYVVAMAKNAVLRRHAEPALIVAQAQSAASGQTAHVDTHRGATRAAS